MFFKKKSIELNCYTSYNHVYDMFKIESAKKHIPDWFKELPSTFTDPRSVNPIPTVKTCVGIASYFRNGFIIPMWTDAQIGYVQANNGYTNTTQFVTQFSDGATKCQVHEQKQIGNNFMPDQTYANFKIFSPWVFDCDEDIDWLWTQPAYNFKYPDELILLPGALEFKYNSNVFINLGMRKLNENKEPKCINIEAGQPLVHLIPLTDRKEIGRAHV